MDPLPKYYYARCLELLGHMYLTGEGIERADVDSSEVCLKDAIGIRDALPQAYLDLGIINHYFRNNITEAVKCYTHLRESQSSTGAELFQLDKIYKSGLLPKDGEFASLWIEKESSPNVISIGMLPEKFIEHAAIFTAATAPFTKMRLTTRVRSFSRVLAGDLWLRSMGLGGSCTQGKIWWPHTLERHLWSSFSGTLRQPYGSMHRLRSRALKPRRQTLHSFFTNPPSCWKTLHRCPKKESCLRPRTISVLMDNTTPTLSL